MTGCVFIIFARASSRESGEHTAPTGMHSKTSDLRRSGIGS